MKARYTDEQQGGVEVTLLEGENLGLMDGPSVFTVGMQAGNREYDELQVWIEHALLEIDPYEPPALGVPLVITDRQFFTQLALDDVISFDEAEATSDGTMPTLLQDIIDSIPDPTERFKAAMLAKNATTFDLNLPLVSFVAQKLNWNRERLTTLWSNGSKL